MSKSAKIVIGVIVLLAIVGGYYWQKNRGESVPGGTIKIGFMAPLTGPFADWGESIKRGMELAIEDTHHKFDVNFQDDGCSLSKGVGIAQKFFNVDKIKLIVGPGCVEVLRPIAPLADQNKALLFSTGLLDDAIFQEFQSVVNFATQISTEAQYMAEYMKSQNAKRVAMVHGTNYFGEEFGKRFPEELSSRSMMLTDNEPTSLDLTDFRTIILKIIATKPDSIYIHQGEKQIGLFAKQLRELGSKLPIFAVYATESPSTLVAGGVALEGAHYTYPVNNSENSESKKNFEKRYSDKFGNGAFPSATSFFVYDGMMILDKALDSCGANDTTCIKNFFTSIGKYQGLSGDMIFNSDGKVVRQFGIKKIENGKFVWVARDLNLIN